MIKFLLKYLALSISIATTILAFVPDTIIAKVNLFNEIPEDWHLFLCKIMGLLFVFLLTLLIMSFREFIRRKIRINGYNYCIQVEYGDLFSCDGCQKIIPFDECFTLTVGTAPNEIKENSICGQYLLSHSAHEIEKIISNFDLKPERGKSKYNNQARYKSGVLIPNNDCLLMAFANLDENGRAFFPSVDEYLTTIKVMWTEIHKYYQMKDVCIPVLGGGLTTIGEKSPTNQELVDLIIESYKLYAPKIKKPHKLRIICRKEDGISLNKVGQMI